MTILYTNGEQEKVGVWCDTVRRIIYAAKMKYLREDPRRPPDQRDRYPIVLLCSNIEYYGLKHIDHIQPLVWEESRFLLEGLPVVITHFE